MAADRGDRDRSARSPAVETARDRLNPRHRLVVLGASNLAMGFPSFVQAAGNAWDVPLDILAALGHGRSYGQSSMVLGRGLPGIRDCRLWEDLERRPALPSSALITDVGNDLLYGIPTERVTEWVESALRRLQKYCRQIAITPLPLGTIRRLRPMQYQMLRSIFFPRSRLAYDDAMQRSEELNAKLLATAELLDVSVVELQPDWYRFDAIHLRRRAFLKAWRAVFAEWRQEVQGRVRVAWQRRLQFLLLPPAHRTLFGFEQQRSQPAAQWADGTRISLY